MSVFKEQLQKIAKPGKAWDRFEELGLPTRASEVFRYVRLSDLYDRTFAAPPSALAGKPQPGLVFVNGRYAKELSTPPPGVTVLPFAAAERTFGAFQRGRLASLLKEESDPFALLAHALSQEGVFIYVSPKCLYEEPLIVHHLVDGAQPLLAAPRIQMYVGKEAALKVFVKSTCRGAHWINGAMDCVLDERATLEYTEFASDAPEAWVLQAVRAKVKKEGRFISLVVAPGSRTTRHDFRVALVGEGAEAALYGVGHIRDGRHAHTNVVMEHQEPHCHSTQHFKQVVEGASRASFEGKIYVHPKAQKTEAYQMHNTLLLDHSAQCYSKPNLEIFADDVKASHGATSGQLDKEALFYFKTRGLDDESAEKLLVRGFIREILGRITLPSWREEAYGCTL